MEQQTYSTNRYTDKNNLCTLGVPSKIINVFH